MVDGNEKGISDVDVNFDEDIMEENIAEIIDYGQKEQVNHALDPVETVDPETLKLYSDFEKFCMDKSGISSSSGTKIVIPTGIDIMDAYLGGGWGVGTLGIIVGNPGSGKSMLAMQTIASMQKTFMKQRPMAMFLDSEEATTPIRLANLGVRYPRIRPYTDMTVERVFTMIENMCLYKEDTNTVDVPSIVVWDSIANTLTQKEREAADPKEVIGQKQRMLTLLIPKYISKLNKYNILLLGVNQLRDNISGSMGGKFAPAPDLKNLSNNKIMPGGNILKFNASQLMEARIGAKQTLEKHGFNGYIAKFKAVKNKLFTPNLEFEVVGDFVRGFNNFRTNYKLLTDTKRLHAASWSYLMNLPDKKFRTKDAERLYSEDATFKAAYDEAVADAIQKDIIEKFNPDLGY